MELKQKEILDTLILCEYKGDTILLTDDDSWAKPVLRGMGHKCKISHSVGSFNPRVFLSAARKRNSHSPDTGFFSKQLQTSEAVPHSAQRISVMERRRWHYSLLETRRVSLTKIQCTVQQKSGSFFIHPSWVYSQIFSSYATPDFVIVVCIVFPPPSLSLRLWLPDAKLLCSPPSHLLSCLLLAFTLLPRVFQDLLSCSTSLWYRDNISVC